jgi:WD40 repeat protein
MAFNPNSQLAAIGMENGQIFIMNLETMQVAVILKGHLSSVTKLAFSNDGRILASSSLDGTIRFWGVP